MSQQKNSNRKAMINARNQAIMVAGAQGPKNAWHSIDTSDPTSQGLVI